MKTFTRLADTPSVVREAEHGGSGVLHFRRLWVSQDFASPIDFIDFTVVPPGTTIGKHHHEGNEEAYFVAAGRPLMRVDGQEKRLEKGDISVVRSGQWHELLNDTADDVEILVVQVSVPADTANGLIP